MKRISYKVNNYYKKFAHKAKYIKGTIRGNLVKAYWFNRVPNFGDLLNPILLKHYGLTPLHVSRQAAEALVIGSNLDMQKDDFSGYIVGTGLKNDIYKEFPKAKIFAVRGEFTRERIDIQKKIPIGDPGLLIPMMVKKPEKKIYLLGIVPHFIDKNDEKLKRITSRKNNKITIIDVQTKPKNVIKNIMQCEYILSSSLHGLIAADSLGIPNGWIILSDKVQGKGFKFYDYASAFGRSIKPSFITGNESIKELIKMTHDVSNRIVEIQEELDIVLKKFSEEIRSKNN